MKKRNSNLFLGLGLCCLVLGILIVAFPFLKEGYEEHKQQQILTAWQAAFENLEDGETEKDREEQTIRKQEGTDDAMEASQEELLNEDEVVGILEIPKIELEQPVLEGATREHLNVALATVTSETAPGKPGNFSVAGHNSRTFGRHFNRLDELETGDKVTVRTVNGNYSYRITGKYVVEAEDLWVLEDTLEQPELTLITCYYPAEGGKQRLIVKGILEE